MSAKAISEARGKELLNRHLKDEAIKNRVATVTENPNWDGLLQNHPWLLTEKLVAKPDQLIKRRGKLGLIKAGVDFEGAKKWLTEMIGKDIQVGAARGKLKNFVIEPFVAHSQNEEFYMCIFSQRNEDVILFHHEGGIDIGDVDSKAVRLDVPLGTSVSSDTVTSNLLPNVSQDAQHILCRFIVALYEIYKDLHFTYLEINPLVVTDKKLYILDLAAKIDQCAEFLCKAKWGDVMEFPPPFGRDALPEEAYIADLDAKSGASLKLTVLNKEGRIWTMVAGGGASVIYADTICDLGGASELANYGEYSGAPSEMQTYEYAKTILSLMTEKRHLQDHPVNREATDPAQVQDDGPPPKKIKSLLESDFLKQDGKILIIGGGIANFTNVATTFKGIVRALREYQQKLIENKVSIYVRRGGPNYQEGLRVMKELGSTLGVPIHVYGPETHMTAIVSMALGKKDIPETPQPVQTTANFLLPGGTNMQATFCQAQLTAISVNLMYNPMYKVPHFKEKILGQRSPMSARKSSTDSGPSGGRSSALQAAAAAAASATSGSRGPQLFSHSTKAIIWGMQQRAVQGMLDFDYVCSRDEPSVVAMMYPFTGDHRQKFYWGHKEILIPVYKNMADAMKKHPQADVLVNFASLRSAYESTIETLNYPQIRSIAIIAEGIPENLTRHLIQEANKKGVSIIGPATVGGVMPGCFKIGNTGGMLDNILSSKLYRPGSIAYVSRSGGMSNELNNIIALNTNGVYEGVAIGGDRYPGTTFPDHIMRYQEAEDVKMLVLLGEVGGVEEYRVIEQMKSGKITKPLVAWCIGTCAGMFTSEVQFGHAGSCANAAKETADAKNKALKAAGAHVPNSFDELGTVIKQVYESLVADGTIIPQPEQPPPTVPMDYAWARELGLIRKPASFMTSICDERGSELLYAGTPITDIFKEDMGIGGVLSLLWFQRRLPKYATKFIEMCLMVTADHGPAVSGAHNAIVCTRAGKDLVSALASGLLTIGDRFGGALDAAAKQFSEAYDSNLIPMEFVNSMRKKGKLIMGIGHRVKSLNNPDMRVVILKDYVKQHFPAHPLLDYACEVEKITTSKKPNLILNVDGFIGVAMVDLFRNCGCFTREEAQEYVEIGALNGLFVLGRSMGFIGHYLDQKRLKQGLYRHPWDDISYILPESLHESL